MLRDPAAAMRSLYFYILRRSDHRYHGAMIDGGVSFTEWLSDNSRDHLDNHQVRWLVGRVDAGPIGRDDLEKAKRILILGCKAFGIVERFDESMLLFQEALGWGLPCYRPRNALHRPEDDAVMTGEARALLAEHHALSFELVAYARELFDRLVQSRGWEFAERLAQFREVNATWPA
jgi:hypothetical protein